MRLFVYILLFIFSSNLVTAENNFHIVKMYVNEGNKLLKVNKKTEALSNFQMALVESPYNPSCHAIIANCYFSLQQYANAIYHCEKAKELGYQSNTLYNNLGLLYGYIAYDSDALKYLNKVSSPTHNTYLNKGAILERNSRFEESLKHMRLSIDADENSSPVPWFNIGIIHEHTNQTDSAIFYYRKVLKEYPEYWNVYTALAAILKKEGYPASEYKPLCEKVLDKISADSKEQGDMRLRSDAYDALDNKAKVGEISQALFPDFDTFVKLYPRSYFFVYERGKLFLNLGDREAAIADYKKSLSLNPNFHEAKNALKEIESNQSN